MLQKSDIVVRINWRVTEYDKIHGRSKLCLEGGASVTPFFLGKNESLFIDRCIMEYRSPLINDLVFRLLRSILQKRFVVILVKLFEK
jgi:hypothetical protein